jgi:hypothetical protein
MRGLGGSERALVKRGEGFGVGTICCARAGRRQSFGEEALEGLGVMLLDFRILVA